MHFHSGLHVQVRLHAGRFKGTVEAKDGKLIANASPVTIFGERDPVAIQWSLAGAEYIVESTVRSSFLC